MTDFFKVATALAALIGGAILLIPVIQYMRNGMYDTYNGYGVKIFVSLVVGVCLVAAGATFLWRRGKWYKP